uniref:Uncharacterized protein n=1 Tax=uncultured organism TaxID=155900 RepID=D8VN58_9ZZZZ|nr:hypothetical protein [uncultured organism]
MATSGWCTSESLTVESGEGKVTVSISSPPDVNSTESPLKVGRFALELELEIELEIDLALEVELEIELELEITLKLEIELELETTPRLELELILTGVWLGLEPPPPPQPASNETSPNASRVLNLVVIGFNVDIRIVIISMY